MVIWFSVYIKYLVRYKGLKFDRAHCDSNFFPGEYLSTGRTFSMYYMKILLQKWVHSVLAFLRNELSLNT
jgi:hypothetical protein